MTSIGLFQTRKSFEGNNHPLLTQPDAPTNFYRFPHQALSRCPNPSDFKPHQAVPDTPKTNPPKPHNKIPQLTKVIPANCLAYPVSQLHLRGGSDEGSGNEADDERYDETDDDDDDSFYGKNDAPQDHGQSDNDSYYDESGAREDDSDFEDIQSEYD